MLIGCLINLIINYEQNVIATDLSRENASYHMLYLWFVETHVISHNVKFCHVRASVSFHPLGDKGQWVAKLVPHGQGKFKAPLLSKAIEQIENGAACCLVSLQEHDVYVGLTRPQRVPLGIVRGKRVEGVRPLWLHPAIGKKEQIMT